MTFARLLKQPSAYIPMAKSGSALLIMVLHVARFGTAREADEGSAAHLWQLLMVAQAAAMLYFAVSWVPRARKESLLVLALQMGAALIAAAPVFILGF